MQDAALERIVMTPGGSRKIEYLAHHWESLSLVLSVIGLEEFAHGVLPLQVHRVLVDSLPNHLEVLFDTQVEEEQLVATKDRILGDSGTLEQCEHLRPYRGMSEVVVGALAWLEVKQERDSLHGFSPPFRHYFQPIAALIAFANSNAKYIQ
jgi:hypothetical protein